MANEKKNQQQARLSRSMYAICFLILGAIFIAVLHFGLMAADMPGLASTLLGYTAADPSVITSDQTSVLPYPVSIQNIMWLMFFLTVAELFFRAQEARAAKSHLRAGYLPADEDNIVLQQGDLTPIFRKVRSKISDEAAMLPRMVYQSILQFQNSLSIDQSANLLNSQMELLSHQLELRYSNIRYLVWLIPTLGFIGTVYGISITLAQVSGMDSTDPNLLVVATQKLAVAFDTTLLALIQSAVLMYFLHIVESKEEEYLNLSCQDCLKNLINRLYVRTEE